MARNQGKNSNGTSENRSQNKAGKSSTGSFLSSVRQRPLASAAIAAGAAGAGAFLWARRAQIGEITEGLTGQSSAGGQSSSDGQAGVASSAGFQQEELTATSPSTSSAGTSGRRGRGSKAPAVDPLIDDQIETGAIAYGA